MCTTSSWQIGQFIRSIVGDGLRRNADLIAVVLAQIARPGRRAGQANSGGRPKVATEVKELARQHGVEAIETLIRLMHSKNEAVAIRAAEALLARRSGNPAQESDVENERPLQIIITDAPSPSTPAASVASERKKPSPEVIIT